MPRSSVHLQDQHKCHTLNEGFFCLCYHYARTSTGLKSTPSIPKGSQRHKGESTGRERASAASKGSITTWGSAVKSTVHTCTGSSAAPTELSTLTMQSFVINSLSSIKFRSSPDIFKTDHIHFLHASKCIIIKKIYIKGQNETTELDTKTADAQHLLATTFRLAAFSQRHQYRVKTSVSGDRGLTRFDSSVTPSGQIVDT